MIRTGKVTDEIIRRIGTFIDNKKLFDIGDIGLREGILASLLYPTDDHLLHEDQFSAVKKMLGEHEDLYVLQVGWSDMLGDDTNELFILSAPFDEEYSSLDLYTFTLLFSDSYQWMVLIDESQEGGIGLFLGGEDTIARFEALYRRTKQDIIHFVDFHLQEQAKRNQTLSVLPEVIRLLRKNALK